MFLLGIAELKSSKCLSHADVEKTCLASELLTPLAAAVLRNVFVVLQLRASARNTLFYKGMPGPLLSKVVTQHRGLLSAWEVPAAPHLPCSLHSGTSTPEEPCPEDAWSEPACRNVQSLIKACLVPLVSDDAELFSAYLVATCSSSFHIFPTFLLYCLFLSFDYLA